MLGLWVNFWKRESFHGKYQISITCELWSGRLAEEPFFSRVEREERVQMKARVFRLYSFTCLFSSYQCLIRACAESTRNKCLSEYFEASERSKDQLESSLLFRQQREKRKGYFGQKIQRIVWEYIDMLEE